MIEPVSNIDSIKWTPPLKFFNVCRHRDKTTGRSSIVFQPNRVNNKYPLKYKGICLKCLKEFSLTQEEYKYFIEKGELPKKI